MTKKRFAIGSNVRQGITEIMNSVDNNASTVRYGDISLPKIELDPNNPRELFLTITDVRDGIKSSDANFEQKKREVAELESLAKTIEKEGVINPIVVYKFTDNYRLIAGERRLLASFLAKKEDIPAKILLKKPDAVTLKILQWIENNERVGLSLREKLGNLKSIVDAYTAENTDAALSIELIRNLTGLSKTQASYYVSVMKSPGDLRDKIEKNEINNLDKAAFIASIHDAEMRANLLSACLDGMNLKNLRIMLAKEGEKRKKEKLKKTVESRGRKSQYINLGKINDVEIIRKLANIVLAHPSYAGFANEFEMSDWNEHKQIEKYFQKLLTLIAKN
jgi:ParB family chromosome partitioning protein